MTQEQKTTTTELGWRERAFLLRWCLEQNPSGPPDDALAHYREMLPLCSYDWSRDTLTIDGGLPLTVGVGWQSVEAFKARGLPENPDILRQ